MASGAPQKRRAVTDLPRLDPKTHAPQVALVRWLGTQDQTEYTHQNELLNVMMDATGRERGNGMEPFEHLVGVGILERMAGEDGEPGPWFRLSDKGRLVLNRLGQPPAKTDLAARAKALLTREDDQVQDDQPQIAPHTRAKPGRTPSEFDIARRELKAAGLNAGGSKAEILERAAKLRQGGAVSKPGRKIQPSTPA